MGKGLITRRKKVDEREIDKERKRDSETVGEIE
jgi:hypothetical protein